MYSLEASLEHCKAARDDTDESTDGRIASKFVSLLRQPSYYILSRKLQRARTWAMLLKCNGSIHLSNGMAVCE